MVGDYQIWHGGTNEDRIRLRVYPFAFCLVGKLNMLMERSRAVDFIDVWLALRDFREREGSRIQSRMEALTPGWTFDSEMALINLSRLTSDEWRAELSPVMSNGVVPPFDKVKQDLQEWLPRRREATRQKTG